MLIGPFVLRKGHQGRYFSLSACVWVCECVSVCISLAIGNKMATAKVTDWKHSNWLVCHVETNKNKTKQKSKTKVTNRSWARGRRAKPYERKRRCSAARAGCTWHHVHVSRLSAGCHWLLIRRWHLNGAAAIHNWNGDEMQPIRSWWNATLFQWSVPTGWNSGRMSRSVLASFRPSVLPAIRPSGYPVQRLSGYPVIWSSGHRSFCCVMEVKSTVRRVHVRRQGSGHVPTATNDVRECF